MQREVLFRNLDIQWVDPECKLDCLSDTELTQYSLTHKLRCKYCARSTLHSHRDTRLRIRQAPNQEASIISRGVIAVDLDQLEPRVE
jgi:hypothetical protein